MCLFLAATLALAPPLPVGPHDPLTAPTRVQHALFALETDAAPVAVMGDVDGDGFDELVVQRLNELIVVAGGSGDARHSLGPVAPLRQRRVMGGGPAWAVGPDVDGDGVPDVAVLSERESLRPIELRSGRTGAVLRRWPGSQNSDAGALAWAGDVDGDGLAELAVASPRGPEVRLLSTAVQDPGAVLWTSTLDRGDYRHVRLQNVGDRSGDGADDLLVDAGPRQGGAAVWLSGSNGRPFDDPLGKGGAYTRIGDVDGDGLPDLVEEVGDPGGYPWGEFQIRASGGPHGWQRSSYPDLWPDYPSIAPVGDVNGDGVSDLAVGDSNYHLIGDDAAVDLGALTLHQVLALESKPTSVAQESGCAWVMSGVDGARILAIFGEPGTHEGLGMSVYGVGDQNGDGVPDVAVGSGTRHYVFATRALSADPFVWMPGRWRSVRATPKGDRVQEETWLAPAAGCMPGISRSYLEGAESGGSFEFLRIEREEGSLALFAQPSGAAPTRFEATEVGPRRILFTCPQHDFPTRIAYTREGNRLRAEVGTEDKPRALVLEWTLVKGW